MAEHGESHGHHESPEKKRKHGSWMEKMKKAVGFAGLGTLGANYLLVLTVCATLPAYVLAGATVAAAYGLLTPTGEKKKAAGGSPDHGTHH